MSDIISIRTKNPEQLKKLMDEAVAEIKKGTARNFTRNDLMIDAIEAYCKGVLRNKKGGG